MLKEIGTVAVLVAAVATSGAVLAAKDAPARLPAKNAALTQLAGGKPFAGICKASDVVDTRPDPAWVGASFAHDNCTAPAMPAPVDGLTASREQIVAGMVAVKRYAAASDVFQRCISDFLVARKTQTDETKKPMDAVLTILENHRIAASERDKKKFSDLVKVAINNFNAFGSGCDD
jgi:hypothetical protein